MNFYNYMMRNYRNAEEPKGDLARDMFEDRERFPRNGRGKFDGWHRIIVNHLSRCGASEECMEVFEAAWEEYVGCEKSRSRKKS